MFETVGQDVRYTMRGLRRAPGFALTVILTLALGTGANVAIFSIVEHTLFRQLPVPEPDRLVNLASPGPRAGSTSGNSGLGPVSHIFSYALFRDLERVQTVFTGIAAQRDFDANVSFKGEASHESGWLVSGSYFPVLGVRPALGRLLTPDDDRTRGAHPVAVLNYEYWQTRFDSDPAVLNEALIVNGQAMTIVGVAPPDFVSTTLHDAPRIFVTLSMAALMRPDWNGFDDRLDHWLYLFARLKPGLAREDAERMMSVPFAALMREVELPAQGRALRPAAREALQNRRLYLEPGDQGQRPEREDLSRLALLLFAVTGIVLLMACANVANLLLARGVYRTNELTMRMSIGAGRGRLVRLLLVEAVLLSIAGSLSGALLAVWTLGVLAPLLPGSETFQFTFNGSFFLFTLLVSVTTVFLIGLYPALFSTRGDLTAAVKGITTSSAPRGAVRTRTVLTTAQIALSLTLLVVAGLFMKSLINIGRLDLGIQPDNLLTFRISPELSGYPRERARLLVDRIEREVAALPGVASVSTSTIPLLDGYGWSNGVTVEGAAAAEESPNTADVGPGYFRTVGLPLIAGREFTASDTETAPRVAIVNEAFLRIFDIGTDVVGRRMGIGRGNAVAMDIQIVGVVQDAAYSDVKSPPPPQFYLPYRQIQRFGAVNFYVRAASSAAPLAATIPPLMARVDSVVPVENLRTMTDQMSASVESDRSMTTLAAAFASLAMMLAAIGLYGVLSYNVAQRRREIGVRMALGANAWRITRLVFGQVGRMTVAGTVVGSVAAVGVGRLARSMLFGIEGPDPLVMGGAALGVAIVALGAAALPARRAARVHPVEALRAS